jgi:ABC-type nickel/cobalt efflux system permease component RcnA
VLIGRGRTILLALALFVTEYSVLSTQHCHAHPIPRSEYDRNITVTWHSDAVHVLYRVEIDEYTLLTTVGNPANGFPLNRDKRVGRKELGEAYLARMKTVIADHLQVAVDGEDLKFAATDAKVEYADSAQFRFRFKADANLKPGRHTLVVKDLNYEDKKGKLALKFEADAELKVEKVTEPPEGRSINVSEDERRTIDATVVVPVSLTEIGPSPRVVSETPTETEPIEARDGFWDLFNKVESSEKLSVLLDTDVGLWMILLIAALHGVLHSVSPGHGKTMVAAYLIGEQGTPRHALILGLIVTLTHTSTAFIVALLLRFALPETAAPTVRAVLGIGGGAIVAFIGLWLLMQRLSGRSDHVHIGGSHSHSHGDEGGHVHSHGLTPEQFGRVGWARLILLGISGGIVPCWGAILWVLYCVTAGRYGLAVWAVLAFSVGLASILILIGLSVVWSGRIGAKAFRGRSWFRVAIKWLPIVGAAFVVLIGLWLVRLNLPQ